MACPKCNNQRYPEEFNAGEVRNEQDVAVKYCKDCGYPRPSRETLDRILKKALEVKHLVKPHGAELKEIDRKYWGETLDKQRRPLEELEKLREQWNRDWENNYAAAPNFYDWIGTIKADATVLQLTAEKRIPYLVTVKNKQLTGNYVNPKNSEYAFVLDASGNFYAAPKQTGGEIRIHHSSFMGGAPVQCAGIFFCNKNVSEHTKEIFYVKDYSGHYQPGIPELLRLKKRLVDLGEGELTLWYFGTGHVQKYNGAIGAFTGKGASFKEL